MEYRINHTTQYNYSDPVPVCQNKVHLAPREFPGQACKQYRLFVTPEPIRIDTKYDYFGNRVDYFSLLDSHRGMTVTSTSLVRVSEDSEVAPPEVSVAWEEVVGALSDLPPRTGLDECLFAFGSEFVRSDPMYAEYAKPSFPPGRPIFDAAKELTARIFNEFRYYPQATNVNTPVSQVFEQRAGVCQDFAHLQISCLRSLGLAARYVSGYLRTAPPPGKPRLTGADASHAWISVYCGPLGWIDFDPTNNVVPKTDHITIGYGRDYGDICPIQGVFVGGGDHTMSVSVDVQPIEKREANRP
jgi:transglutaminase-like putative cysteine protease